MSVTDWDRIRLRAGPNSDFPNKQVYCYGSFSRMTNDWYTRFKIEAEAEGFEVAIHRGVVYLLESVVCRGPGCSELVQEPGDVCGFRCEEARD